MRESFKSGKSLEWTRVHDVPDFAYFNHAIHIKKGIGCVTCHGPVNEMPLTWREHTLHMKWCLDCHRDPEQSLRPPEQVFSMTWKPEVGKESPEELRRRLMEDLRIGVQMDDEGRVINDSHHNKLTNCSTCHR